MKEGKRVYLGTDCIRSGHATNRATASAVWIPKTWGREWRQSTVPIQVKISCSRMKKILLSLIYAHLFLCLVIHYKQSDNHFDIDNSKLFLYRFIQDRNIKGLPYIKIHDQYV